MEDVIKEYLDEVISRVVCTGERRKRSKMLTNRWREVRREKAMCRNGHTASVDDSGTLTVSDSLSLEFGKTDSLVFDSLTGQAQV